MVVEAGAATTQKVIFCTQMILDTVQQVIDITYLVTHLTTPTGVFQRYRIILTIWFLTIYAVSGAIFVTHFCMFAPRLTVKDIDIPSQLLSTVTRIL